MDNGRDQSELWCEWVEKALERRASDIHAVPEVDQVRIMFRVEGRLQEVDALSPGNYSEALREVKRASMLDVNEKNLPQDGRIKISVQSRELDLRIATLPTVTGEKLVMRILDSKAITLDPDRIFSRSEDREEFAQLLNLPLGMVLFCGPTGSGKTTTAYTALYQLAQKGGMSIQTVEDPVEYLLPGVSHLQVKSSAGLTFLSALRSVMRTDPDVIYSSEIREKEELDFLVRIALTGHLVYSSMHTEDAASTIRRLADIISEPFLLSSALSGIVSQRLIRKNCPHCKVEETPGKEEARLLELNQDQKICRSIGCEKCNQTGYRGRVGVYEFCRPDREFKEFLRKGDLKKLEKQFSRCSHLSLLDKAKLEIRDGNTTPEEVLRIFGPVHS